MDTDTFLTTLYVMADDFCKYRLPPERVPGPRGSLSRSEVVTLVAPSLTPICGVATNQVPPKRALPMAVSADCHFQSTPQLQYEESINPNQDSFNVLR
jgi:hypothetical protein